MNKIRTLKVVLDGCHVGTLATASNGMIAFEYSGEWLEKGFSISPFSLPLEKRVFMPQKEHFEGLFGVFADSLPDGWGRLLVDRMLLERHINPYEVDQINRLAIVGENGMGALEYIPSHKFNINEEQEDYDELAAQCKIFLKTDYSENLDELFVLGGSSGGARPKILTTYDGEEWIIKFPSSIDKDSIGKEEYRYSQYAKACGIEMMECKLFSSKTCAGYFGTKRFDRYKDEKGNLKKRHMVSVSALLETSHRIPNLDYNMLMKLTMHLTKDFEEVTKLYRRMCFNVFAHNRDDHSKNFSFLYDREKREWSLSPAYDLTYSNSIGGEHATCVNGNGSNPDKEDLLQVAKNIGMDNRLAKRISDEIQCITNELQGTSNGGL